MVNVLHVEKWDKLLNKKSQPSDLAVAIPKKLLKLIDSTF